MSMLFQSNFKNSSTLKSALRINARRVPTDSSLCWGIERLTLTPGLTITTWLPTCPKGCQPVFWNALTASLPEMLPSLPIPLYRYHNGLMSRSMS